MANVLDGRWEIIGDDGTTWDLAPPSGGVTRIAGIGLPPARRIVVETPTKDGSADAGFVLADREVIVGLMWRCRGGMLAAERRRKPYKVLSYLNAPVTMRRVLSDQSRLELRQLWYNGGMELDSAQAFDDAEYAAISFICRDPAWYDPDAKTLTVAYASMDHGVYGDSINLTAAANGLSTDGDWYAYPTVEILGPCTNFDLTSATTGQRLRYYGAVADGETVTICCNPHPAYLSAESDVAGDVRAWINPADDFGGFCLWPAPMATAGANEWDVSTTGMDAGSSVVFSWEDRYQGA